MPDINPLVAAGRPNPDARARWGGGARVTEACCDRCGARYIDYVKRLAKAKRHYCSADCQRADRAGKNNPKWRGGKVEIECPICGTKFPVLPCQSSGARKTCSRKCRAEFVRKYPDDLTAKRYRNRRNCAKRRAPDGLKGRHTFAEWEDLKRRAKHRCVKCRKRKPLTRDHIIPLCLGGSDEITNIQPLCMSCNCRKHTLRENLL